VDCKGYSFRRALKIELDRRFKSEVQQVLIPLKPKCRRGERRPNIDS
jgi:hypothetical protein